MTDEEMAEEYCNEMMCTVCSNIICGHKGKCSEWETRKRTFLAGLKAGRPQWHDLRKNPNDLPKIGERVLVLLEDKLYDISSISTDNRWICTDYYTGEDTVIAWCEIPTFDKE